MTSEDFKSISTCELFNTQVLELKQMKTDLEKLKHELTAVQTKYHQQLADYEAKCEQLYLHTEKIQQKQDEKETNLLNATAEWLDVKTKLESSAISPKQKVKLNVGGESFETTIETLTKYSGGTTSYFNALFSRQWQVEKDPNDDSIFIDRDGCLFGYILQYLRTGKVAVSPDEDLLRSDLIIEAQFYNIDNLVNLLNIKQSKKENNIKPNPLPDIKKLYSDTKILSLSDQEELNKLSGFGNQQWQLIYRASRDGYNARDFHQSCDGCFPTISVIRSTNGFIFGGFTSVPWESINADKADASAFLFTLTNPHGIKPTKYTPIDRTVGSAIRHCRYGGPTFGSGRHGGIDISLKSPFNENISRISFPHTYRDTTKMDRYTFTGDSRFSCDDVEIFTLI